MKFITFGMWLGYAGYTPMKREGITRYVLYLTKHIIKNYKVKCEIWCYEINKKEVELLFSELLNDEYYKNLIEIKTENSKPENTKYNLFFDSWRLNYSRRNRISASWKLPYKNFKESVQIIYNSEKKRNAFNKAIDNILLFILLCKGVIDKILSKIYKNRSVLNNPEENLVVIANSFSKADCFIIPVFLLTNALFLNKPKLMALHDLHLYDFYDLFVKEWGKKDTDNWLFSFDDSVKKIENYLENEKLFFVSNCDYVRKNHTLKYIKNSKEDLTDFVYLPVIIPESIEKKLLPEYSLRKKYKIDTDYIFFPTQVRPYKNVIALLKALNILVKNKLKIKVVLTGKVKDSELAERFINENNLSDHIVQTGDVSEEDLYSLHKYAAATVVTTLFEGGFPWPALEALFMDTPVILSRIPMVEERIRAIGYNIEDCGLRFFNPHDFETLSKDIEYSILNREKIVDEQRNIKKALLGYNWDDVSRKYYSIITNKILK